VHLSAEACPSHPLSRAVRRRHPPPHRRFLHRHFTTWRQSSIILPIRYPSGRWP